MIFWRRLLQRPPPFICASGMSPATRENDGRIFRHASARSHFVWANGTPAGPTTIYEMSSDHLGDVGCGSYPPFVPSIGFTLARIVTAHSVTNEASQPFRNSKLLAKEDLLTIEGFIAEILSDGRFAVRLDNQHKIIAYTAGKMRKFRIRSVVGDRVHLEMTPYDQPRVGSYFVSAVPTTRAWRYGATISENE